MYPPIPKIPSVLSPPLLCPLTSGASFPLPKILRLLISSVTLFQTSLWSSGFGMKLEAVTPFLGKYRPFVGRCCQTCTPKSWVSDGRAGLHQGNLGKLTTGAMALGSSFLYVQPSSTHACALVFQGNGCTCVGCVVGQGWLPGLQELGGVVQREEIGHGQRTGVWPGLHESCSVLGTLPT